MCCIIDNCAVGSRFPSDSVQDERQSYCSVCFIEGIVLQHHAVMQIYVIWTVLLFKTSRHICMVHWCVCFHKHGQCEIAVSHDVNKKVCTDAYVPTMVEVTTVWMCCSNSMMSPRKSCACVNIWCTISTCNTKDGQLSSQTLKTSPGTGSIMHCSYLYTRIQDFIVIIVTMISLNLNWFVHT